MAVVTAVVVDDFVKSKSSKAFWETLTETNNFGSTFDVSSLRDICVHVYGDFGTSGSLTVYGSNDPADVDTTPVSSSKWIPVVFAKNGNAATFTAAGGGQLLDNYSYICVGVTAGTGVDLDVRIKARMKGRINMADINISQFEAFLEGELNKLSLVTFGLEQCRAFKNISSQIAAADASKSKAVAELDSLNKEVAEAKSNLKKEKDKAEKVKEDADNLAASIISNAESKANEIVSDAVVRSDDIDKKLKATSAKLADVSKKLDSKSAELESANVELAAIKAKFAVIAGA